MKKWLRAQPDQPATLAELQTLLDTFADEYNHHRPHRSLPHRATPATAYKARPKPPQAPTATPTPTTGSAPTGSTTRQRHPARQRPAAPHRHRTNPRPNPRPPARPGPRHPHHRRRHRRAPPRAGPSTPPATTNPPEHPRTHRRPEMTKPDPGRGSGRSDVLRHHTVGLTGFEPAILDPQSSALPSCATARTLLARGPRSDRKTTSGPPVSRNRPTSSGPRSQPGRRLGVVR